MRAKPSSPSMPSAFSISPGDSLWVRSRPASSIAMGKEKDGTGKPQSEWPYARKGSGTGVHHFLSPRSSAITFAAL